jgi:hypothetical protein
VCDLPHPKIDSPPCAPLTKLLSQIVRNGYVNNTTNFASL